MRLDYTVSRIHAADGGMGGDTVTIRLNHDGLLEVVDLGMIRDVHSAFQAT